MAHPDARSVPSLAARGGSRRVGRAPLPSSPPTERRVLRLAVAASQTLARGMVAQGVRRGSVLGGKAVAAGNVFRNSAKKVVNAIIMELGVLGRTESRKLGKA